MKTRKKSKSSQWSQHTGWMTSFGANRGQSAYDGKGLVMFKRTHWQGVHGWSEMMSAFASQGKMETNYILLKV